VKINSLLSFH